MLGDAEIKYATNGLLSLTPDTMPCLGETTEVRNLWSAAAVWVKEGPGMAQVVAEWMTHGYPRVIDVHGADISRFYDEERTDEHIWSRADEHFKRPTASSTRPSSGRGAATLPSVPTSPANRHSRRCFSRPAPGSVHSGTAATPPFVERYGLSEREVEWDNRWWSPITIGEHLNMREHCGVVDLSAFQIYELPARGPSSTPSA
ncbi:MAG: hypothetical protein CM1200mP26_05040 [Acidimicrobiales bacterium]|nr:MAG: hypothetical protein CM1200mP26_05040 [Acidimicrobiales bacterium]